MKQIRITYAATITLLTLLWLLADPFLFSPYEFFAFRASMINYTGIAAIGTMSVAMVLALRLTFIETRVGGLDKAYRLHKWLGITGFIFAIFHFLLANIPKIVIEEADLKQAATELQASLLPVFQNHLTLAEEFGDWGFKVLVVLLLIALVKRFSYRAFVLSHRLLSPLYLFLLIHSVILMKTSYWSNALAPIMVVLMIAGAFVAVVSMLGKVGYGKRGVGEVERFEYLENNTVLKVGIRMRSRWDGHEEGQFAFLTFDKREDAHPFTIASAWTGDGAIGFFIKALGDYTKTLPSVIKVGDLVMVEGPYGRFHFDSDKKRQIWIAGGIGIAPFVARIKALRNHPQDKQIDFFYSASKSDDEQFLGKIKKEALNANIQVHILRSNIDGRLDADKVCAAVPYWKEAEVLFCGPTAFGDALSKGFTNKGFPEEDFHRELFDMR
ncbi:MAG: ferric reductase-like transmembrane domain-containing protein [Candidatus Thiodiazotropha sp.]